MNSAAAWVLGAGSSPAPIDRRKWRGAFVIPNALPGIPWGDYRRIWTPAYGCYTDAWQAQIRAAFKARGYTHFVYNCAGLPYGTDYPELTDDPARVARDLDGLEANGILPVVCAAVDTDGNTTPCRAFIENAARIKVCFPMWEMNGPLHNDTELQKRLITHVRAAAPSADCYLHFTPGHGSISADEIGGWRWCQDQGVIGLLSQDDHWRDPAGTGLGLEGTALRLSGQIAGWEGMRLLNVAFEQTTTPVYHDWWGWDEAAQIAFTTEMLHYCGGTIAGWCDGGPRT